MRKKSARTSERAAWLMPHGALSSRSVSYILISSATSAAWVAQKKRLSSLWIRPAP